MTAPATSHTRRFAAWILGGALILGSLVNPSVSASAAETAMTASVRQVVAGAACQSMGVRYTSGEWYWWSVARWGARIENCSGSTKRVQFILRGGAPYGFCVSVAPSGSTQNQATTPFGGFRFC